MMNNKECALISIFKVYKEAAALFQSVYAKNNDICTLLA